MDITLKRFMSTDNGTFGVLEYNCTKFYTVEKPWNMNLPYASCVPSGKYFLVPHKSNKYGDTLCLVNNDTGVTHFEQADSKRFACLIHVANYASDVEGCIGLGDRKVDNMVTNSRQSIIDFYNDVDPNEYHNITITWEE